MDSQKQLVGKLKRFSFEVRGIPYFSRTGLLVLLTESLKKETQAKKNWGFKKEGGQRY